MKKFCVSEKCEQLSYYKEIRFQIKTVNSYFIKLYNMSITCNKKIKIKTIVGKQVKLETPITQTTLTTQSKQFKKIKKYWKEKGEAVHNINGP